MTPPDPSSSTPEPAAKRRAEEPYLMPHSYDGIQEYDQRLPNWWLLTFYGAIVFAFCYWLAAYQFNVFGRDGAHVDEEVARLRPKPVELKSEDVDAMIFAWSQDPAKVDAGRQTFEMMCAPCHAKDLSATMNGTPLPGLPLNDAEWKYGGKPSDILKVVTNGSPDVTKGMMAWGPQLGPTKCQEIVAFILTRQPGKGEKEPPPAESAPAPEN